MSIILGEERKMGEGRRRREWGKKISGEWERREFMVKRFLTGTARERAREKLQDSRKRGIKCI